jgi:nucleoside transporter
MATDPFGEPVPESRRMSGGVRFRLSVMMFLQFFIWGAWFELGFDYIPRLGFSADQQTLVFGAFNVGALVALFFSTQFADRKFAAEKFLAFSHLIGGLAILGLYFIKKEPGEASAPFWPFFLLMLIHSLFYVPTISITNSIAFANLTDPARQFGPVRVWGTIGWIAASWPFIFILVDWTAVAQKQTSGFVDWLGTALGTSLQGEPAMDLKRSIFLVAGIASLVLAAFSLTLPHTPPKPATTGADSLAWLKAMRLLKNPFVLVLFIVTFIDAAVHGSFFFWTFTFLGPVKDGGVVDIPANWVGAVMKIGQVAEILTMLVLGYVLKRLGWRWTMVVGVLGHVARFAVFAYFPQREAAILINVVHGICYAFFFATVYIFVDEFFPKDVRSSAQGLFNVLILGLGPLAANFVCPWLKSRYEFVTEAGVKTVNYPAVFEYSIIAGLIGAFILAVFFNPKVSDREPDFNQAEEDAPPAP